MDRITVIYNEDSTGPIAVCDSGVTVQTFDHYTFDIDLRLAKAWADGYKAGQVAVARGIRDFAAKLEED